VRAWAGGRHSYARGPDMPRDPRCQISEVQNSLAFAWYATLNRWGTPLLSDDGLVMFASLALVGHFAQRARTLSPGRPVSLLLLAASSAESAQALAGLRGWIALRASQPASRLVERGRKPSSAESSGSPPPLVPSAIHGLLSPQAPPVLYSLVLFLAARLEGRITQRHKT
jgi:hypothetical protein